MSQFDTIVIGAGVNGLVAGAVLARRGKSVCILEQGDTVGGMAGLTSSDGPALAHLIYNLNSRVRRDIGLGGKDWPFKSKALPTVSLSEDGKHVVVDGAAVRFADGSDHPQATACSDLIRRLTRYGDLLRQLAEAPPPGGDSPVSRAGLKQLWWLGRFGLGVKRLGKSEMRAFLQVLLSNAYDFILDELPDGRLSGILAADAVRGAATGPRSPGTVFSLIYRMGHGGDVTLPQGGTAAVMETLSNAAKQAGCTLKTGAPVVRILTDNDHVTGIETASGDRVYAKQVLSSVAPLPTARLAGLHHFDIEATRRIRNIRARGTTAKVNLRLSRAPVIPGLPGNLLGARLLFAPSADYVEQAFNPAKYGDMSSAPVIEAVLPAPQMDRPWLSTIVQYAPSDLSGGWTDAAREELLQTTLATLARISPTLPELVEEAQVITPDLIEQATGAPGGHWHHAEMSLDQLLTIRPANLLGRYAIGPKGLFLCGAATHPGGDIMGLSGRNAALMALEKTG
ncbi:phytoene desaturase family protein [Marimonas lutisalis]|uniref:phytoene desaturase family protein n=1 Tax=Marimonas lutisalis TaxID=2545756 RepID=UPI0010F83DFF|nr:NAD(P)/FAD-dependent oxidoreductase [Marimonas lutisalis]